MTRPDAIRNLLLAASVLFVLAACARREEEPLEGEPPPSAVAGDDAPAASAAETHAPVASDFVQGPKVVAPIQVEVVLTPAAKAELTAKSESIVIEALYGGDPTPAAASQVNEFGLVQLGKTQQTLPPTGGTAGFSEDEINRQRLDLIVGQPQVMFNVRSARNAVPKNLLACELYWNSVKVASSGPIQIPCRLLSEPPPPRAPVAGQAKPATAAERAEAQAKARAQAEAQAREAAEHRNRTAPQSRQNASDATPRSDQSGLVRRNGTSN